METITTITGNGNPSTKDLPLLVWLSKAINPEALAHVQENTGLTFIRKCWGYEAQPTESRQIVALFLTYNFKTKYCDNIDERNTLFLKTDHHVGFKVDSICLECVQKNHIPVNGLKQGDRLAC